MKSRPHFLTQPSWLRTPISNPKGMQVQLIWELHFENYCSSLAGWGSSYLVKFLTLRCFSCSKPWTSPWSVLLFPVPFLSGESPWSLLVCGSNGPALARVSGRPWRLSVLCQGQWLKQGGSLQDTGKSTGLSSESGVMVTWALCPKTSLQALSHCSPCPRL